MNGWEITGIVIGVLILLGIVVNFKDLVRYFKISSM